MPKFVTIGYGDQAGYDRTPRIVRDAAHEHDAKLRSEGALIGIAGRAVQVRNPDAVHLKTVDGPVHVLPLPIAGFAVIEAANLAEAIEKVSHVPCAVAHGVAKYGHWSRASARWREPLALAWAGTVHYMCHRATRFSRPHQAEAGETQTTNTVRAARASVSRGVAERRGRRMSAVARKDRTSAMA